MRSGKDRHPKSDKSTNTLRTTGLLVYMDEGLHDDSRHVGNVHRCVQRRGRRGLGIPPLQVPAEFWSMPDFNVSSTSV